MPTSGANLGEPPMSLPQTWEYVSALGWELICAQRYGRNKRKQVRPQIGQTFYGMIYGGGDGGREATKNGTEAQAKDDVCKEDVLEAFNDDTLAISAYPVMYCFMRE